MSSIATRTAVLLLLAGIAGASGAAMAAAGGGASLTPHRAIYELSFDRAAPGSGVSDVNGRIVYEITGNACEGYTQNMRFVSVTSNQEGTQQQTDLRTSSWEAVPSHKLRFSWSNYQNEALAEQARGMAQRAGPGRAVTVELAKPEMKSFEIPAGALFPIEHSMALLDAARKGKAVFTADLYDGSENGAKVYATSAAIGKPVAAGASPSLAGLKDAAKLDEVPSWPISLSYFEKSERHKDEMPLYEMSYRFHENGVTSGLTIDYGEYAIKGALKELTYLEAGKCEPAAQ